LAQFEGQAPQATVNGREALLEAETEAGAGQVRVGAVQIREADDHLPMTRPVALRVAQGHLGARRLPAVRGHSGQLKEGPRAPEKMAQTLDQRDAIRRRRVGPKRPQQCCPPSLRQAQLGELSAQRAIHSATPLRREGAESLLEAAQAALL